MGWNKLERKRICVLCSNIILKDELCYTIHHHGWRSNKKYDICATHFKMVLAEQCNHFNVCETIKNSFLMTNMFNCPKFKGVLCQKE